jgi:hypothetical protein
MLLRLVVAALAGSLALEVLASPLTAEYTGLLYSYASKKKKVRGVFFEGYFCRESGAKRAL